MYTLWNEVVFLFLPVNNFVYGNVFIVFLMVSIQNKLQGLFYPMPGVLHLRSNSIWQWPSFFLPLYSSLSLVADLADNSSVHNAMPNCSVLSRLPGSLVSHVSNPQKVLDDTSTGSTRSVLSYPIFWRLVHCGSQGSSLSCGGLRFLQSVQHVRRSAIRFAIYLKTMHSTLLSSHS